jgi:hypothetical protein
VAEGIEVVLCHCSRTIVAQHQRLAGAVVEAGYGPGVAVFLVKIERDATSRQSGRESVMFGGYLWTDLSESWRDGAKDGRSK